MKELVNKVREYVVNKSNEYKNDSVDHYDFWNEHIKYVYHEAVLLAVKYNADIEIVSLGALLHDIALIEKVGDRKVASYLDMEKFYFKEEQDKYGVVGIEMKLI